MSRALLLGLLVAPAMAAAQTQGACPWLNAGTAAKALGAEVKVTANTTSAWSGTCQFVAASGSVEVNVSSRAGDVCGAGSAAVRGIGNTAVRCSRRDATGRTEDLIEGRVRDAWFVVELAEAGRERRGAQGEATERAAVVYLAEQVAGNLY